MRKAIALVLSILCAVVGSLPATATEVVPLHQLVVTGVSSPIRVNLLPYTVSVIDSTQLESTGSTQVLSAISGTVPSLFVTERGIFGFGVSNGGSGHIKLRGVGGDRASAVLMMVDGQPQFAGLYSHHIADFYGKENVERVEVLRGPGSVLYGSNAMAGAINVITKTPKRNGVHTTVSSQYGSYNTWLNSVTNMTRFGKFSSLVSASYNRTDGNIKNFDFKQADAYAKIGYDFSANWKATADYTLMHFTGNDPVYPTLSNPESTDIYHQNITRGEASLSASNRYGSSSGIIRAYYSYGNHFIDDPKHFHSVDDRFGVMLNQNFKMWKGNTATVGFDFDTYSGKIPMSGGKPQSPANLGTISRKKIVEYSPYITMSQTFADNILNINAGLRMANSDKFSTQWVPQVGFSVNPNKFYIFKGNIAMGYRNPSFRELYLYKMANPDLNPEKMINYELSASRWFEGGIIKKIELTAYFSKGTDMIQVVDQKNVNTGSFINKGIEVTVHSYPVNNLHIYASYSYLHTSLNNLTGAPKNQYFVGVEFNKWKNFNFALDLKGVGGLYVAEGIHNQNYALLNLKVSYDACKFLSLFARFENITDARYTINRGYPMPGFTALGGLKINF